MSHIHILFIMLLILNITTNRFRGAATSKHIIYSILMKVFCMRTYAENMRKNAKTLRKSEEKLRIQTIFLRTWWVADGAHADAVRCGRQSTHAGVDYLPTSIPDPPQRGTQFVPGSCVQVPAWTTRTPPPSSFLVVCKSGYGTAECTLQWCLISGCPRESISRVRLLTWAWRMLLSHAWTLPS